MDAVRKTHHAIGVLAVLEPKCMSELVSRLFSCAFDEQFVVGWKTVKNWIESADGHQRNVSWTLSLTEHEV